MSENYEAKIELYRMLLERNEYNRARWNAYQRYAYAFKRKNKDVEQRRVEFLELRQALYDFTGRTYQRRQELQRMFNTKQRKSGVNEVRSIILNDKRAFVSDMPKLIEEYEVDNILLGE